MSSGTGDELHGKGDVKDAPDKEGERTGEYGGDDGAMEHEQALVAPGEDPGSAWESPGGDPRGQSQAERKQEQDLESGAENPG